MLSSMIKTLQPHLLQLDSARLRNASAVVGYDGFVDEMSSVIKTRLPGGEIEIVPTITEFSQLIGAAAGRSFGREIAVKRVEAGGNGPNLADGLMSLGMTVDYYGTLGDPIDPVFAPFADRCRSCTTIGACGRTLALEFADGKLQLNNTGRLGELTPVVMNRLIDTPDFATRCRNATLLGFANWSRYPNMTACWRVIVERVLAGLASRPWAVVDLADPSGSDPAAIREMMDVVKSMTATCRVVFGANLNETGVLLSALGSPRPTEDPDSMTSAAETLRRRMDAQLVVVHSQRRAAASWSEAPGETPWRSGQAVIDGAYNPKPVRTTGVGDRFNAGLGAALVAGLPPDAALAMGCAAGAWFVTVGRPLELADLASLESRLAR